MSRFSLLTATRTIEHAMPFVLYRFVVYLGMAMACLFAALAGAGTFVAFASFTKNPSSVASLGGLAGVVGFTYLAYKFRSSLFFNVEAGQLVLLGEQARGAKLPEGKAQIDFAKQQAQTTLNPALLHEITELSGKTARQLANSSLGAAAGESNPALNWLRGLVASQVSQSFLVSHFQGIHGPWEAAAHGMTLFTRHFKVLFGYATYALAFECAGLVAAFIALLYPANSIAGSLPVDVGPWRYFFALIFAWSVKSAFFKPIATTALSQALGELPEPTSLEMETLHSELSRQVPAFEEMRSRAI